MMFPWKTLLQWVLPTIPQIISTVRTMQKEQHIPAQPSSTGDLLARIEELEKALELQSQINTALTFQLQQFQRRPQVLTFVAIFALVLAIIALGIVFLR